MIFTKPARAGRVKTRLIGDLSAEQAAHLHEAFVGDVVERMAQGPFALRLAWALDDGEAVPVFSASQDLAGAVAGTKAIPGFRQEGDGLGERLFQGLAWAAREHSHVAALGSDHPSIPLRRLEEAFEALEGGADVAVGPAEDGGYYLIALSRESLNPRVFDEIRWSTEEVFPATLERCRELGLEVAVLEEGSDVDRPEDLRRLARDLAAGSLDRAGTPCPRTLRLLESWGRLPEEGLSAEDGLPEDGLPEDRFEGESS